MVPEDMHIIVFLLMAVTVNGLTLAAKQAFTISVRLTFVSILL